MGLILVLAAGPLAPALAAEVKTPVLAWGNCPPAAPGAASTSAFQCAVAVVPIDYEHPGDGSFHLAVIRHPAEKPAQRIGTLFWNPGGPGDSGTEYLPAGIGRFPAALRERFDIVSWDPRGMGGHTTPAVQCFDSAAEEARFLAARASDGIPDSPSAIARELGQRAELNAACIAHAGPLLAHLSTADNARDLDLLRRAVGEDRISYYGTSYGTFLGATYINMFPDHVRATVLDGGVAPTAWVGGAGEDLSLSTFVRLGSDFGAAATLDAFLTACGEAATGDCAFSAGSASATHAKWSELMTRAAAGGVSLDGEKVSGSAIASYVMSSIYLVDPLPGFDRFPGYRAVAQMLQGLWSAPASAAGAPASPKPDGAPPATAAPAPYATSAGRQLAVICGESPNPGTVAAGVAQAQASFRRAGLSPWPFGAVCLGWTARAAHPYRGPWNRPRRQPVLVIASSFDPATAFGSSVRLSQELADARLLPVLGFGHTVLFNPDRCAQAYVADYLTNLKLPPTGAACKDDRSPFEGG